MDLGFGSDHRSTIQRTSGLSLASGQELPLSLQNEVPGTSVRTPFLPPRHTNRAEILSKHFDSQILPEGLQANLLCAGESVSAFTYFLQGEPDAPGEPIGPWPLPTILFPRSSCFFTFDDGETVVATANQAVLVNAGATLRHQPIGAATSGDGITLDPTYFARAASISNSPGNRFHETLAILHDADYACLRTWFKRAERRQRQFSGWVLPLLVDQISEWFDTWKSVLPRYQAHNRCTLERRRHVESAKFKVAQHLFDDFSVLRLARLQRIAPYYLARSFQTDTGYTVKSFVQSLRMREAFDKLLSGNFDAADVAKEFGYDEARHLTRVLRMRFGMVPGIGQ